MDSSNIYGSLYDDTYINFNSEFLSPLNDFQPAENLQEFSTAPGEFNQEKLEQLDSPAADETELNLMELELNKYNQDSFLVKMEDFDCADSILNNFSEASLNSLLLNSEFIDCNNNFIVTEKLNCFERNGFDFPDLCSPAVSSTRSHSFSSSSSLPLYSDTHFPSFPAQHTSHPPRRFTGDFTQFSTIAVQNLATDPEQEKCRSAFMLDKNSSFIFPPVDPDRKSYTVSTPHQSARGIQQRGKLYKDEKINTLKLQKVDKEELRKCKRRDSNRRAATKYREKIKSEQQESILKHESVCLENEALKIEIQGLKSMIFALKSSISQHNQVCPFLKR